MKTCSKCKEPKPESEFHKRKYSKDGYSHHCAVCIGVYAKEYRKKNNRKVGLNYKRYRESEKGRKNRKEWMEKYKDERKAYQRKYHKENGDRIRKLRIDRYALLRRQVIEKYEGRCVKCHENDFDVLCIDHVKGGGRKDRSKMNGYAFILKVLRTKSPEDYQVLCANCNLKKAIVNGELASQG